jgi:hypothetical protein
MPSLPEWAISRVATLQKNNQPDPTTDRRSDFWTLPRSMMPSDEQRHAMTAHIAALTPRLSETPENGDAWAKATIVLVTKMLMVLPAAQSGPETADARGEAYMVALEDIPAWAVDAAIRGWYRSAYDPAYNYRWAPGPAELRAVAYLEAWKVKERIRDLTRVLEAKPLFECRADLAEKVKPLLTMRKA